MIGHRIRDIGVALAGHLPVTPAEPRERDILLIRPDHLGDLLFLTPALRRLRRALPEGRARIVLAVGPWSAAVVRGNPAIDEILTIPFPGFSRMGGCSPIEPYRLLAQWSEKIRELAPTATVVLRDDHWWAALMTQRAGIPLRIGVDHPAVKRYLTHPVPLPSAGPHWVQRNAALLDATAAMLGGAIPAEPVTPQTAPLCWRVSNEDEQAAAALLAEQHVSAPYLVVAPGSGAPVKLWPAARWGQVISSVAARHELPVLFTGSSSESDLIERVRAHTSMDVPSTSLAGKTGLGVLAAILKRARLVVGPDSGPLHLAVAVGVPTVHLYGPSDATTYGPWGDPAKHRVVSAGMRCPRCGDLSLGRPEGAACMLAISSDRVAGVMSEMLADGD